MKAKRVKCVRLSYQRRPTSDKPHNELFCLPLPKPALVASWGSGFVAAALIKEALSGSETADWDA
jgi:hypothetical protein